MIGTVEHFLELHRRGLRLVPCRGKVALMRNWPELHLGEQDIRDWSREGVNWAAVCGDPLCVLDTDTAEAEAWVQEQKIESPVMVRSGRGGLHRYFLSPPDVDVHSTSAAHGIKGLDVKGWRSYILLPGSVHPETGIQYTWVFGCELGQLHELPIFNPGWVRREEPRVLVPASGRRPAVSRVREIRDVFAYIRGIRSIQGQGGDRACFTVACFLIEAGLTPEDALQEMHVWNAANAFPQWSPVALRHKLRYACKKVLGFDPGQQWEQLPG